jgi:predicted membrane channel-forming protein YqfA (hemolysin III family)
MSRSQARLAWVGFFAVVGGAALASLAGLLARDTSSGLLVVAWVIGAFLGSIWAWSDDVDARELRFTRDGWTVLGWMCVFLLPPLGVALGLVLRARGSSQGTPMIAVSVAAFAAYSIFAQVI